jgi:hypothetical protein
MNLINKKPISSLGYGFVAKEYIPKGKNEYFLRDMQNRSGIRYRRLTAKETEVLVRNGNTSDDWDKVQVSDSFNADLVQGCNFYGLVRIGKLEPYFLEFNNLRLPVGLYNSTIISCDLGDNVAINNVHFMSHYIIGNDVILVNVNELATSNHSKFGNGILKKDEPEAVRIWVEVCNENAGRSILPFNGMLAGDAWLWSKYRDNEVLLNRFKEFTERRFDTQRGYYGKIGDRTVIKNCRIIKDVWIGTDAYIKGANKLKNLTINSSAEAKTQIGEGCELVNGIMGFGCRAFYGVKAVRFILGSHSQLKYGARLINSYLGDNSTISCCEVLNSLIFPAHEQHHNNSFLCAATVMGQSNMAAGATIGSNHNSRGADGEIVAGRGFWPGLCVSLKHNCKFPSFTLLAKGDFPAELNIQIPFSLVTNDVTNDRLVIMPAYWFQYNMYALARNAGKYEARDQRIDKIQLLEFDYLAPDSVNEIFDGLTMIEEAVGKAFAATEKKKIVDYRAKGSQLLKSGNSKIENLEVLATDVENSKRKVVLVKTAEASKIFRELIVYYGVTQLIEYIRRQNIKSFAQLVRSLPASPKRNQWINVGGQLMPSTVVKKLIRDAESGAITSWDGIHDVYQQQQERYPKEKFQHAWASLVESENINTATFSVKLFAKLLDQVLITQEWMAEGIYASRAKDYMNPFRKMVYDTEKEMEQVMGKLKDNSFIRQQATETKQFNEKINAIRDLFGITS